jgi:hypothetical protein
MNNKQKAIKALSCFEIEELPELSARVIVNKEMPTEVYRYLNNVIDQVITEVLDDAISRIQQLDAQAKADVDSLIVKKEEKRLSHRERALANPGKRINCS